MPLSWNEIRTRAITFSKEWSGVSSESAEAQSFWNDFFHVFDVPRRRVSTFEAKVEKVGGKTGYIDLFWPGVMLAEHKSRGQDLDRAFQQATDYCPGLSDAELPRYIVISDFAQFRIHDLETGDQTTVAIQDLPNRIQVFGFIAGYQARVFREQDPVNTDAAEKLGKLHDGLLDAGFDGHDLEVYLVRILFCLFAEDTGIFMPRGAFADLIEQRTSEDGSDMGARLAELFEVLNKPEDKRLKTRDEQFSAFPYVNGELFAERLPIAAFDSRLRGLLLDCCNLDWGQISPAIFGSLFQGIMDAKVRRSLGAHYTSEKNILKVIEPLFLDDLWAEFERLRQRKDTRRKAELTGFHDKLARLEFLDPACGCGNFLVIAYREIRRLEVEVIRELYAGDMQQLAFDAIDHYVKVDVDQFHGIEIEEWPAQIARVAMWLMDHQANLEVAREFGKQLVRVPLVKSANIVHGNALRVDWNQIVPAEECSFIMGNPPFVGGKHMSDEQRDSHRSVFGDWNNAGLLDFVAGWYVLAANYMHRNPSIEAALVSTNSITQGEQAGALWPALYERGVRINFAHRTFRWSNEASGQAAVHCVIVGFSLTERSKKALYEYDDPRGEPQMIEPERINPYLADGPELVVSRRRSPICAVPGIGIGNKPIDGGHYLFTDEEKKAFLEIEPKAEKLFRPWVGAKELINGYHRWCLFVQAVSPAEMRSMPRVMERVQAVKAVRDASKSAPTKRLAKTPTRFHVENFPDGDCIVFPRHSSETREFMPIRYYSSEYLAGDALLVMPIATPYHFGVLNSTMHNAWIRSVGGRIKSDYRYSKDIVYNNFPWPETSLTQRKNIETTAQAILDARSNHPESTLADLYDPLTMPADLRKAHDANDRAVDAAYGRRKFKAEAERVGFLFERYQALVEAGE